MWILAGLLGFVILVVVGLVGAGAYFAHKVKQNPALAFTRLIVAANPDAEVVSTDEGAGTITVRDKKTGKVVTLNFEDIKRGKISFKEEGKDEVTLETKGSGESGVFEMRSGNQTVKLGADVKVPSWLPAYPGAKIEGTLSAQGGDSEGGSFAFKTGDSVEKIFAFYEAGLKGAGLKVSTTKSDEGGMIMAEDKTTGRSAMVTIGKEDDANAVHIVFGVKK
ncbi:MAG: hypothetical protein ACE15B_10915 [Bryobacteraceae bacterium]